MLLSPRISTRELSQLCHRLAISVEAGIDSRTIWAREAQRAKGSSRIRFAGISEAVKQGESLRDALSETGEFFPVLFREMVDVGEQTGRLDSIFSLLAEHYQGRLTLRRHFLMAITWPLIELGLAVAVIGFFIWFMGVIRQMTNGDFDPLGLGLYGNRGLAIYLAFVTIVILIIWLTIHAISRGLAWTRPIQRAVMHIPMLGKTIETLALARFAWSFNLTLHSGMNIRRALQLSLASTNNARYTDQIDTVDKEIEKGNSILEAFHCSRLFSRRFSRCHGRGRAKRKSGRLDGRIIAPISRASPVRNENFKHHSRLPGLDDYRRHYRHNDFPFRPILSQCHKPSSRSMNTRTDKL